MWIESFKIYVAETEIPTVYAVSVRVVGILRDSCNAYHETNYNEPETRKILSPNYFGGDTITIEITQSKSTSIEDYCLTAEHYHVPVLFLGFFEHGEYTLKINNYSEKFSVG